MSSDPEPRRPRRGRPPAGRPRLTREAILATALALVDAHGLDALTMRRLAGELGADPMSIYHHLPGKDAIVSGLVGVVFAEMRPPEDAGTWDERVLGWARAYRGLARAHPNLVLQIVTDAAAVGEAAVLVDEPLYAALESAGLPPTTIVHAAGLLVDYVNGFVLAEAGPTAGQADDTIADALDRHDPDRFPVQRRVHAAAEPGGGFEAGLDIVLRGIRTLVPGRPG
ncbi:TetR/AcrR family transcriptional regulator [Pseudonocardia humida]|uniref:TetR/AcrR family transcriptional regulator n=1 Tax=Pseudonocardia humida TaxID=2800819 RepID=A0ABT1A4Q1_9PSEU|nr:TetR/AcrR family transcriptional regulator [Pseudonocardia humida]MCO1657967.1 TetR/AcrR family transcriptional regulator [Pseudonocardia humida]